MGSPRPQNIYYAAAKQGQPSASGHKDHTQYPPLKRSVSTISRDLCRNHLTLQNSSKSQSFTLRSVPVRVHVPTTGATGWLLPCLYSEPGAAWCCPGGLLFSHYTYAYGGLGDLGDLELRAFGVYRSFTIKIATKQQQKQLSFVIWPTASILYHLCGSDTLAFWPPYIRSLEQYPRVSPSFLTSGVHPDWRGRSQSTGPLVTRISMKCFLRFYILYIIP